MFRSVIGLNLIQNFRTNFKSLCKSVMSMVKAEKTLSFLCEICGKRYTSLTNAKNCEQSLTPPFLYGIGEHVRIIDWTEDSANWKNYVSATVKDKKRIASSFSGVKKHVNVYSVERVGSKIEEVAEGNLMDDFGNIRNKETLNMMEKLRQEFSKDKIDFKKYRKILGSYSHS